MALIYVYSEDGATRKKMCDCELYDEAGNKYSPLSHTKPIYVYDQNGTRYLLLCCGKEIEDSGTQGTTVVTFPYPEGITPTQGAIIEYDMATQPDKLVMSSLGTSVSTGYRGDLSLQSDLNAALNPDEPIVGYGYGCFVYEPAVTVTSLTGTITAPLTNTGWLIKAHCPEDITFDNRPGDMINKIIWDLNHNITGGAFATFQIHMDFWKNVNPSRAYVGLITNSIDTSFEPTLNGEANGTAALSNFFKPRSRQMTLFITPNAGQKVNVTIVNNQTSAILGTHLTTFGGNNNFYTLPDLSNVAEVKIQMTTTVL